MTLPQQQRLERASELLSKWQSEAQRRAKFLHAPAAWQLATDRDNRAIIQALDPTGDLSADLNRVCAEAIAEQADYRMIPSCRPLTTRGRREPTRQPRGIGIEGRSW